MKIILSGGGTLGHVTPLLSIYKFLKNKHENLEVIYIGSDNGVERNEIEKYYKEIKYYPIKIQGFERKITFSNFVTLKKLLTSKKSCDDIIKKFKPDLLITGGGFVCGPVALSAKSKEIKIVALEQNCIPGLTTKYINKFAKATCISFNESRKYFKNKKNLILTGNPVREDFYKVKNKQTKNNVLFVGGSMGSKELNKIAKSYIENSTTYDKVKMITGSQYFRQYNNLNKYKNVEVVPFDRDIVKSMSNAKLVVCRAGANTITEMITMNKIGLYVPSPNVTANQQEINSKVITNTNAGFVCLEKNVTFRTVDEILHKLLDKNFEEKVINNIKSITIDNPTRRIVEIIESVI